jgi:hypothetical protein
MVPFGNVMFAWAVITKEVLAKTVGVVSPVTAGTNT